MLDEFVCQFLHAYVNISSGWLVSSAQFFEPVVAILTSSLCRAKSWFFRSFLQPMSEAHQVHVPASVTDNGNAAPHMSQVSTICHLPHPHHELSIIALRRCALQMYSRL